MRCSNRRRPEATAAAPSGKAIASGKGTVWLLTGGLRGDHEPVAALAMGLQAAGQRVKVLGASFMADLFSGLGIDFEAIDTHPVLRESNKELRTKMHNRAVDMGFEGDDALEDYLLDVVILEHEHLCRHAQQMGREGKHPLESMLRTLPLLAEAQAILSGKIDKWKERDRVCRKRQMEETKMSMEECAAHRKEYRAFWRKIAAERGVHAVTACDAFQAATAFQPDKEQIEMWVAEQLAWKSSKNFSEMWERWPRTKGNWLQTGGLNFFTRKDPWSNWSVQNLLLSFDAAQHKPDVLIYHWVTSSMPAWALRHLRGVSLVPLELQFPAPLDIGARIVFFKMCVEAEGKSGYGTPITLDVWGFLTSLETPWHLVGVSRLGFNPKRPNSRINDSKDLLATMRSCHNGSWHLEEVLPKQHDLPERFFGSASDRECLERFLSAEEGKEPPVFFGWGSSEFSRGPAALASLLVRTVRLTGQRAIFVVNCSGVTSEDLEQAFRVEYKGNPDSLEEAKARLLVLPSAWLPGLLPRCVAAVHHGGVGTTQTVLRSGTPGIVTPLGPGQPDCGGWTQVLGCGLVTFALDQLMAEDVAGKVREVIGNETMKAKAQDVACKMRAEPGVTAAVELVEKFLREMPQPDASPIGVKSCPDGPYGVFSPDGRHCGKLQFRNGSGFTEESPFPTNLMRWGKFFAPEEGTKEWRSYDAQMVDFPNSTLCLCSFSDDGKMVVNPMGWKFQIPSRFGGCTVS